MKTPALFYKGRFFYWSGEPADFMMENGPSQAPAGPRLFYEKPAIIRRPQSHLLPEEEGYTCGPLPTPRCHPKPQAKNLGIHRFGS